MAVLSSVVFGVVLCCSWVSAHVVYPEGEECPDSTCFTPQHYLINASHYFTDNSIFLFRPGSHYLNSSLQVNHVENVTLKAEETGAVIILSSQGTLNLNNTHKMNLIGLVIKYNAGDLKISISVIVSDSNLLTISHCRFEVKFGINLALSRSRGNISDCSFLYGTVSIESSIIQIKHITLYKIYLPEAFTVESSQIKFCEGLFFTDNVDGMTVKNSRIITQGVASFVNNSFTTLSLINSTFEATGELIFNGNHDGYAGGAISFDADSRLRVNAPFNASFIKNSAILGGALFVHDSDTTTITECRRPYTSDTPSQPCFIELGSETNSTSFKNIHIDFKDNTAIAGSLLYGGALKSCKVESNGILQNITGYQFLKNVSTISQNETISSSTLNLVICSCEGYHNCNEHQLNNTVIPGEKFNVSIVAMGQYNSTSAYIDVKVPHSNDHLDLLSKNSLEVGCNNVTFQVLLLKNDGYYSYSNWYVYPYQCTVGNISINIKFEACPNGFTLRDNMCGCEKGLEKLDNIVCDVQSRLIENSGKYWIGPTYNGTYTGFVWLDKCPYGYCKNNNMTHPSRINFTTVNGRDSQCATHRTGILCGACEKGYSLTLSSLMCRKCSSRFLGLVLLFVVAGIGLIALLLALHMTVASGTLNGVILYTNIVNVHADLFMLHHKNIPLTIVISWLNLDFGIPLCLYNGLDAYKYSWLQYAFPLYLWFLTGCIIISSKYFVSVRRLLGSNPVAVLATAILMSFTKILQTTVEGLNYVYLHSSNGTVTKVWLSDGNIEYFAGKHIVLAATGICVIAFLLIPYTVLLLFGYQLQAYSDRKGFRWFNQIIPLLDAYYAPYKKNTRYWPGLMVVMRIGLFLSYILCDDNMMIIISVLFLASITSHLKLYKSIYLDLLEASFALNLCVLCAGTYHIKLNQGNQYILSDICIGIALLELCGIIIFHLYTRFNCSKLFTKFVLKKFHKKSLDKEIISVVPHSDIDYREPLLGSDEKTSFPYYYS